MSRSVKEWIGKTDDARIPSRVRLRVIEAYGCCATCGQKHTAYEIDHILALINGGEHRERNLRPLCRKCHTSKTAVDQSIKAKTDRKKKANLGIKKSGRGFRGWRRFNGEVVWK